MPRIVLGVLVGSMLSVAGSAYQGVFRNPLADPYLLGAGAGAEIATSSSCARQRVATLQTPSRSVREAMNSTPAVSSGRARNGAQASRIVPPEMISCKTSLA